MSVIKPGQKTVLITGCSPGGIGHALCLAFQDQGHYIIATARNPSVLADLADRGMSTLQLDVTDKDSIAECKKQVTALTGGKLDILINNAGRTHTIPATDIELDDVRLTFETNVFGVMAVVQAFAPLLIEAKGLIVNIASLAAIVPYVFAAVYSSSKGAVVSYSRTLRQELRPFGVRVMVAMAGTVKSNINYQTHRELPPGSVYTEIQDTFRWRLTYSSTHATVSTEAFARKLVSATQAPEVPSWLRTWFGRPDWFYAGGHTTLFWWGSFLGEWIVDSWIYRRFKMLAFERQLKAEEGVKKNK